MNTPDLEIASLLIDRYFGVDVVVSRRGGPDFDHQRQRIGKDREYGAVPNLLAVGSRNYHQVWHEDRGRRSPHAKLGNDRVRITVELGKQEMPQKHGNLPVSEGHPWLLHQPPVMQLPAPVHTGQHELLIRLLADPLLDGHPRLQVLSAISYRLLVTGYWLLVAGVPTPLQSTALQPADS